MIQDVLLHSYIQIDISIVFINVSATQTVFTLTEIPITLLPTGTVTSGNVDAVSGGEIFKYIRPKSVELIGNETDLMKLYSLTDGKKYYELKLICNHKNIS